MCETSKACSLLCAIFERTSCHFGFQFDSFTSEEFVTSSGSRSPLEDLEKESISGGQPSQVVAVGTVCPTPSVPSSWLNAQVMVRNFVVGLCFFC